MASGCAALRDRLEADPVPEIAQVLPWTLTDCNVLIALLPATEAAIADRIPDGFDVLALSEIPGIPPQEPRGDANVGVEVWRCASGSGLNATQNVTDIAYGSVFSFVRPPDDLADENATYHFLKWDVLVPDEARRLILQAEGVPALPGNATFDREQPVGPATLFQAAMDLGDDAYGFEATTGQAAEAPASFVEFSETPHGFVVWRTNVTASGMTAGTGLVDLSGASWLRAALGKESEQAYYLAGRASLDGTISIPGHD